MKRLPSVPDVARIPGENDGLWLQAYRDRHGRTDPVAILGNQVNAQEEHGTRLTFVVASDEALRPR